MDIQSFVVRSVSGAIDHEASIGAFATKLLQLEAQLEQEEKDIGAAVHALFDEWKGARLNVPFILSSVVRTLGATPEDHKSMSTKVHKYLQNRSQGKALPDGGWERPNSLFHIGLGKGGGVSRRSDKP